jgi:hypothetical protein
MTDGEGASPTEPESSVKGRARRRSDGPFDEPLDRYATGRTFVA